MNRGKGDKDAVVAPQMPTGGAIGQPVFHHEAHRELDHPPGIMTAGPGQIGQVDIEIPAAVGAIVRRVGDHQINRATGSQIAHVVQGPLSEFVAISQLSASQAGAVVIVGVVGQYSRRRKIVEINDALGGIRDVFAGSEHGKGS